MKYKKLFLMVTLSCTVATQSLAGESGTCLPFPQPAQKFLKPQSVQSLLLDLEKNLGEQRLIETMGKPILEALRSYTKLDSNDIYMNVYLAAAAGGAAAAVVDYVWDRYVGNGGDKRSIFLPQDYFDISPKLKNQLPVYYGEGPSLPKHEGQLPVFVGINPKYVGNNPVAATPAVVGSAVAGAVAYKAVEYSLNKVFGSDSTNFEYDLESFDLKKNLIQKN